MHFSLGEMTLLPTRTGPAQIQLAPFAGGGGHFAGTFSSEVSDPGMRYHGNNFGRGGFPQSEMHPVLALCTSTLI